MTALWIHEKGAQYEVPDEIAKAEGIEDMSWHNDTCPSFGRTMTERPDGDNHDLRIWVEHPDPCERELDTGRFCVTYYAWSNDPIPGLIEMDYGCLYEGNDATEALRAFMTALVVVQAEVARRRTT